MSGYGPFRVLLQRMKEEARELSKSLSRAPEGQLYIVRNGDYLKYLQMTREDGEYVRRGIGKDRERVAELGHKRLEEERLRRERHNIGLLENIIEDSLSLDTDELIAALPKHFDELDRNMLLTGHYTRIESEMQSGGYAQSGRNMLSGGYAQIGWPNPSRDPELRALWLPTDTGGLSPEEWAAKPYRENTKNLEHKMFRTARSVLCRSKSEMSILDIYDDLRLPFHNDEVYRVNGGFLSPDVTGARADRTLVHHEHLGRRNPEYLQHNAQKVALYAQAGVYIGKNLLFTYDNEDGSIDLELIRAQIMNIYGLR